MIISGDNNGEKFSSQISEHICDIFGKKFTHMLLKKIQIERIRICERFEIGSTMIVVMNLCLKFSLVKFSRLNAPRRSELLVNMEPVMVLPSVNPSKRWKSLSTQSISAHSAAR